jgi:hypothetical protein
LTVLYRSFKSIPVRVAVRFPLHLEIVLGTGERQYQAVTEDVSASGVLFAADELPAIGTEVEFEVKKPAAIMGGINDVLLHCAGRIVRHQRTAGKTMAAAVIDEYFFRG